MFDRLQTLMHRLTDNTVLADLLDPVSRALARVRQAAVGRTLTMPDFIALGCSGNCRGCRPCASRCRPCCIWPRGRGAGATGALHLVGCPRVAPPGGGLAGPGAGLGPGDAGGPPGSPGEHSGSGDRPVRAIDGTYQAESAHCRRRTPRQGGEDNPKGHALLSFYNLRLGCRKTSGSTPGAATKPGSCATMIRTPRP